MNLKSNKHNTVALFLEQVCLLECCHLDLLDNTMCQSGNLHLRKDYYLQTPYNVGRARYRPHDLSSFRKMLTQHLSPSQGSLVE